MIVAHEVQQLGLGGTEKTMVLFLRHLRALGVSELHAFAPRGRDLERAAQVAALAELHLYDHVDELARELRALRPNVLHRHRSGYADPLDALELDPRTRIVETNVYGDHGSRADVRLFVSRTVAREQGWTDPVEILYNPCEPPVPGAAVPRSHRRFPGVADADVERVILFGRVGRPSAHIYDPIALEAYARVESPWTRYVALAPPPNMVDHARWLGLTTFLTLPPTTDDRELSRFYSLIDVLAHARRDGETCGMNIQEAMYHGLPVITHLSDQHNAQPEILGPDYPWIAAKGDLDAYARFMREAIESAGRRAELGARNRRRAEREFDAQRITERLFLRYEALVRGEPREAPRTRASEADAAGPSVYELPGFSPEVVAELTASFEQGEGSTFQNAEAEIRAQTRFLIKAIRTSAPRTVLETGTHKAHFSYLVKLARPDAHVHTFGLNASSELAVDVLNRRFGRFVTFQQGDSRATLPEFRPPAQIDFAWVDGGHDRATCLSDLEQCDRLEVPHVCVDDYTGEPQVREAVREFLARGHYTSLAVSPDLRGICWLKREPRTM